jgi:hypothetical protein
LGLASGERLPVSFVLVVFVLVSFVLVSFVLVSFVLVSFVTVTVVVRSMVVMVNLAGKGWWQPQFLNHRRITSVITQQFVAI